MKNLLYTLLCSLILITQIRAQSIRDFSKKENPNWRTFKSEKQIPASTLSRDKAALSLGTNDDLELLDTQDDQLGFRHYRYQQTYKGIPIEGAIYLMHERNNLVKNANGKLALQLNLITTPTISEAIALQTALRFVDASLYAWDDPAHETNLKHTQDCSDASFYPHGELVIIAPGEQKKADDYRLAYKFDIYAVQPLARQIVYVDAQNKTVLTSLEKIHNCTGSPASGATKYSGNVDISACVVGGVYNLRNNDTDTDIHVFDAGNASTFPQAACTDADGFFEQDSAAVEVYWATQNTYDYFFNTHDRNSLDGEGMSLYSWVHFGEGFNNAFWNGSWMTYGDGDNERFSELTSPDVVGHEMMHGITDFSADLVYLNESGALNESFSDIFGEVVEAYSRGTNDWIIGADFTVKEGKNGLRNMSNPKDPNMLTVQPDTYFGNNWYSGDGDKGGVHTNSGVQNYWFYLLAEGGSGTNDFGYAYDLGGIGMSKAAAITYRNLTVYLTPGSQYFDARTGAIQAAVDLYGADSDEALQTEAAWAAVGVGTQVTNTCRQRDSLTLVALYDATNGPNWTETWDLTQPIDTWHGVFLNQGGCVSNISLVSNQLEGNLPADLGNMGSLQYLSLSNNSLNGNIPTILGDLTQLKALDLQENELSGGIPSELGNLTNLTELSLNGNQLSGTIPESLTNLRNLNELLLGNNQLTGEITPYVGYLDNLTALNLTGNQLTGNIPGQLRNLIHLTYLGLGENQFTGEIPHQLSVLSNLTALILMDNQLEGEFPGWIGNLSHLNSLTLASNQLSGCYPSELTSLCQLSSYYSSNARISNGNNFDATWEDFCDTGAGLCDTYSPCRLSDSLNLVAFYNGISGLTWDLNTSMDTWDGVVLNTEGCVIELRLSNKDLYGTISPELANLTELSFFYIGRNNLSGEIPPELGNLTNLKELALYNTNLTGEIPPELGNLASLTFLALDNNNLTGSIPSELGNLTNLEELSISHNNLTGCYDENLANLCNQLLIAMVSEYNNFDATWEDFCSIGAGACAPLQQTCRERDSLALVALYNSTDGANWGQKWNLTQPMSTWYGVRSNQEGCVEDIDLSFNGLTGTIPAAFANLTDLNSLEMRYNALTGTIPPEMGSMTNLSHVELSNNDLSGAIPPELGGMTNLSYLRLWYNNLSGTIPIELTNLTNLEFLSLGRNNLNGTIPIELANLTNLEHLNIQENNLTGEIPAELGNLMNLISLSVRGNSLTGSIPGELGDLTNLNYLDIRENNLTGCFDQNLTNICGVGVHYSSNNFDVTWEDFCSTGSGVCNPSSCRYTDSLALVALYNSTDGANWINTWDLTQPINTWYGVTLTPQKCVSELNLSANQLNGRIPVGLIAANNLRQLTKLNLASNQLTGEIDFYRGAMDNLTELNLADNQLTGYNLFYQFSSLTNLEHLILGNNQLTGEMHYYGTPNSANLKSLNFASNQLTGVIPPELADMTNLELLTLDNNNLSGDIPAQLGNLSNLDVFGVSNNNLEGCYNANLSNLCGQLSTYSISPGNNFDTTWDDFCNTGASTCNFYSPCRQSDSLALVAFYNSVERDYSLGGDDREDYLAEWDLSLPINTWIGVTINSEGCVTELNLREGYLSGPIPSVIGDLSQLRYLNLGQNAFDGTIPAELLNLTELRHLNLDRNNLSGAIPSGLGNLTDLTHLYLDKNNLTGNIPTELGNLTNLAYLYLDNNNLTGNIPTELSNLTNLTNLYLSDNNLTGNIPTELGNLTNLTHLYLDNNNLTGNIPAAIGNLIDIEYLYLDNNNLTGYLPAELGNLTNLRYTDLSNNHLSGCYDANLANLCGQLVNTSKISENNNFNAPWQEFCNAGVGTCNPYSSCRQSDSLALVAFYYSTDGPNWPFPWNLNQPIDTWHNINLDENGCVSGLVFDEAHYIVGSFPPEIADLIHLKTLKFSENTLNGSFPTEILSLSDLEYLKLSDVGLSGSIPPEIGNLSKLTGLHLGYNQLSGNIPPEIGNLNNLTYINLRDNQLSGCYAPNLSNLCSVTSSNFFISESNNFDATWQDFCNTGAGSCDPIATSAVWPGDFNNDGIVDNVDVLTWGLAEGNTGVVRPNATSDWTAQSCPDWQTSVGIVNGKHQDGDGNGTVDVQDLQVLISNYGSTHTSASANSPLQFRLEEVSSTQSNGQITTTYHLFAESSLGTAISTHGLSCSIDFGSLIFSSINVDVSNSALEPDEYIEVFDAERNTLNLALTRTDHNNKIIDGPVVVMVIIHEDLQAGEPFAATVRNGRMMSANGELNSAGSTSLYGMISTSGVADEPLLSVFATAEDCYTLGTATAQIIGGTEPYTYAWSNGANIAQVNNLTAGVYTVEIADANGYAQSLQIEINSPESTYDESGNPVDCSQYIQWANPQIHVWLEGAYHTETGDMRTDMLEKLTTLPFVQPYGQAPWNYRGTEGEGWSLGNYPADAVDWVLVSFRDSENIQTIHRKTAALVLQDGYLYFPDARVLPNTTDPVYIMIQHRNHIAAMTSQPVSAVGNTIIYDFRTSDSYHTDTSVGQKQMPNGNWAMFAGDADPSDTSGYDINGQDKGTWAVSNGNFAEYLPTDLNLDGDVNGADKILWENNNGNSSTLPK